MIKKGNILILFFVCVLGADEINSNIELKEADAITRARKPKMHVIKHYPLPIKGSVHITAQEAPVYVDVIPQQVVTIAVCFKREQERSKQLLLHKGKMIHDDILHIVTKEQDGIAKYYISVPESASVMVVSKGNIHAAIPHARVIAKGQTIHMMFATSTVMQIDETNRCHVQGIISNGRHFDYRPTVELDTQGDIIITLAHNGGLGYGSYLLTQLFEKIKESWQGLQELITDQN